MPCAAISSRFRRARAIVPLSAYPRTTIEGFAVRTHPDVLSHTSDARNANSILRQKLNEITRLLRSDQIVRLRRVPIVLEWDVRSYGACYHVSADWLRENGYDPAKAGCVEVSNLRDFFAQVTTTQPLALLHEFAHAYHYQVLGANYSPLRTAYVRAVNSGLYEHVWRANKTEREKAYALTDTQEFFAELTEAYWGRNDYFPFTRAELQSYDPESCAVIAQIWSSPPPSKPLVSTPA